MASGRRDEVFIIIAFLFLTVPAGAVMKENTSTMISNSSGIGGSPVQTPDWITIDNLPIGTYTTGDSFIVSGKTGFPVGYEIIFGAYLSGFHTGTLDSQLPTYSGSTLVTEGTAGENRWSFIINTTQFEKILRNQTVIRADALPGEYILSIGPSGMVRYPFILVERNATPSSVPVPAYVDQLINRPLSPRATPAPSMIILPVTALGILGILLFRKQE